MSAFNLTDTHHLRSDQYKDSTNLDARAYLHDHFSTNKKGLQRWIFDQALELEVQQILDLGCGPGYLWVQNRERIPQHWKLTFADISWGMLSEAKDQISTIQKSVKYAVSDAQNLPFPDNSFDLVIANHMLYHVPDLNKALAEIRRTLRLGGQLFCTTNSVNHMGELFDWLERAGFDRFRWNEADETSLPFSLENGAQLLRRYFSTEEIRIYEDSLRVTKLEPLLDYILSMTGIREAAASDPGRKTRLISLLKKEFDSKGFIHITKGPGLFIAT